MNTETIGGVKNGWLAGPKRIRPVFGVAAPVLTLLIFVLVQCHWAPKRALTADYRAQGWGKFLSSLNLDVIESDAIESDAIDSDAIESLSRARRRERLLIAGLAALLLLLIATSALIALLRRQRNTLRVVERTLREREDYYRTLVQLLPDTIYVVPANPGTGPEASAIPGSPKTDLALEDLVARVSHREHVRRVLATGEMAIAEETTSEGLSFEYRLAPLRESGGAIKGVMGILRDRTDLRRTQEERARLEEQLRQAQKMESVGLLAGGVAHDFNNLLTLIGGYSELLLRDSPYDSEAVRQLKEIQKAGARGAALTRQLLAFSRKQVIQSAPVNLNPIVIEASEMLERLLGADVDLRIRTAPDLPRIVADRGQMEQVLMNLATNARDAMPEGGLFSIATGVTKWSDEQIRRHAQGIPGECVVLSASDTGQGMDGETLAKVFEPFFTTKPPGRGTGLGLSTVYGIVRQSGGWVTVESRPGSGTTFQIFLPVLPLPPAEAESSHAPETGPELTGVGTILIVEDHAEIRALESQILTSAGHRVLEAASAAEALRLSEDFSGVIDILFTDIVMPGLRGTELARRIRLHRPQIKLLFATGYAGDLLAGRDQLIRESPLLVKPFGLDMLLEAVQKLLGTPERRMA